MDFNKVKIYSQYYEDMEEYDPENGYTDPEYVEYEDYKKLLDAYNKLLGKE